MGDLKKSELLSALADLDSAAEQVVEEALKREDKEPSFAVFARALDAVRLWPEAVREAVDALRKERGDIEDEALLHEKARRLHREFTQRGEQPQSWEVRGCRLVEQKETGERLFEVVLLGDDEPEEMSMLIPLSSPDFADISPSDFCTCAHTRGSHKGDHGPCDLCGCGQFTLLGSSVTRLNVEELPPDPHPDLTIQSPDEEGSAITFIRQLVGASGLDEPDPETWMALQRLLTTGWRIIPPKT